MGESYEAKRGLQCFLVATLTFSQSMGAVIPVAAEELTADTGQGNCRDRRIRRNSSGERCLGNNRGSSFSA